MLKIIGDGSYQNTFINKDGKRVDYYACEIILRSDDSYVELWLTKDEFIKDKIEFIALGGLYGLVGDGSYGDTKLFYNDIEVRGVQSLSLVIKRGSHTTLYLDTVFLPNVVEVKDENDSSSL